MWVALLVLLGAVHCSSTWVTPPAPGPGDSCASDPFACDDGETCWPVDSIPHLSCIPDFATTAQFLTTCAASVGTATCNPRMACDVVPSTSSGICTWYCDGAHPCPTGYTCDVVHYGGDGGPSVSICRAG